MCKNVAPPANFLLKSDNHQVRQQEKINRFRSQSKSLPVQIQLKSDLKANFKKESDMNGFVLTVDSFTARRAAPICNRKSARLASFIFALLAFFHRWIQ